jgi:PAS domain S-box-containing protein
MVQKNHNAGRKDLGGSTIENFRSFFDLCPDFLFVLDMEGRIILANRTVLNLLRYSEPELKGMSVLVLHPEERREEAGAIVAAMVQGLGDFCSIPLLARDGREIPVETRVVKGMWDGVPCLFGYSRNLSELKRSEEKFRSAFEANAALMAISTIQEGRFIDVNEAFLETLGYSREEVIGKTSSQLGMFEDPDARQEMIDMVAQNKSVRNQEVIIRGAGGRRVSGLFSAVPLKGSLSESHLLTVMNDITDRKHAEFQLHESQERLQLVLGGARLGTWDWHIPSGKVCFNKRWAEMLGYALEEIEPYVHAWECLVHPEDAGRVMQVLHAHLNGESDSYEVEHRLKSKSGNWVWVLDSGRVTERDKNGKAIRMAGIHMDISARKGAEAELQRHRDHLEELVNERTQRLEEVQKELVTRAVEAGRAQALDITLHNIGNAITPILLQTEKLVLQTRDNSLNYLRAGYKELCDHQGDLTRYVMEDPRGQNVFSYMGKLLTALFDSQEDSRDVLKAIQNAAGHISQILKAQGASLKREGGKERISVTELVETVLVIQGLSLNKRRIELKTDLRQGLSLTADRNGLMQVVMNLIKNAYEALDALGRNAAKKEIVISSYEEEGQVCMEISDSGIGIDRDGYNHLFEPGVSKKASSGFGLYYCKIWMEANGGSLDIRSDGNGKGATVRLTFRHNNGY